MIHQENAIEKKLHAKVNAANLTNQDYINLYWLLWGACSTDPKKWETFENITEHYLKNKGLKNG
jgi:hypothetical protein